MQNQAAIMYGTHDVRLEERPLPEPGPREVLVEIRAVGVCGSDVHYYEEGRIGSFVVEEPLILGRHRHHRGGARDPDRPRREALPGERADAGRGHGRVGRKS
jgi:hypothetical protein